MRQKRNLASQVMRKGQKQYYADKTTLASMLHLAYALHGHDFG